MCYLSLAICKVAGRKGMYEIDTKNGLPIESVSAGCSFANVVMHGFVDVESAIDWSKVIVPVVSA